ncbi:MAG TPA: hypothetical protein VMV83_03045 [Rectinemataceae bacterium]|nr:hypothetical protein [Rectinemataceae bacterium]
MVTLFDALVVAVLLVIAIELFAILRALAKLSGSLPARLESKEGQTINVNLGQLPVASVPVETPMVERVEAKEAEESKQEAPAVIEAEPEPEPEVPPPPPPPQPRPSPGMRATTSGLTALKCPKCQAENSSYRTECFNCGEKLK